MNTEIKIRIDSDDEPVTVEVNALGEVTIMQGLNGRYSAIYGLSRKQLKDVVNKLDEMLGAA